MSRTENALTCSALYAEIVLNVRRILTIITA